MAKNSNKLSSNQAGAKDKKPKAKTSAVTMAEKRAAQRKNQPKQKREKGRMKEYFKGVKLEMKKVVWPTRKQLVNNTIVSVVVMLVSALGVWGFDYIAGLLVQGLLGLKG